MPLSRRMLLDRVSELLNARIHEHHLEYLRRRGYLRGPAGRIGSCYIYDEDHVTELADACRQHVRELRKAVAS